MDARHASVNTMQREPSSILWFLLISDTSPPKHVLSDVTQSLIEVNLFHLSNQEYCCYF